MALTLTTRHVAPSVDGDTLGTLGLLTVLIGAFLSMADFFIVNVALPTIGADLHASPGLLELIVAGYGLAYALLLVVGGRLGDSFGRRRVFAAGMAAFTVTSLACGLAPTAAALVAGRVLQGAAAALMVPQVLATIQASTVGERRARAISLYGAAGGVAAVTGQIVGGLLVSADLAGTGWRPIFLVNVPIGLLGLALVRRAVPATRAPRAAGLDVAGTVLLGVGVLALLVPLMEGRSLGWPVWLWPVLAVSPIAGVLFLRAERARERSGELALFPTVLLSLPSFRRGMLIGVPFFAGFGAFMFVYAVALQRGVGASPVSAGLSLAPMGTAFLLASLASPRLLTRFGQRAISGGALLQGLGLIGLVATVLLRWPDVGPATLTPAMIVAGAGQGLVMTPLFRSVLSQVPAAVAGAGSGALMTMQQSALAAGVGTLGTLFLTESAASHLGVRDALVLVLAVQVVVAAIVAATSRGLPDPR